ncbi:MAG: 2-dehydropantoate 2-reductase [Deltaproteobacteria bacterium]|nr:2-dehydropantoate 2-reductase [Deltaproteobacteria bacterium]
MALPRMAVVGLGAVGTVLAGALLREKPDTVLALSSPGSRAAWEATGLTVSGTLNYREPAPTLCDRPAALVEFAPGVIFLAVKTFHLPALVEQLAPCVAAGAKLVSAQNGLGTEDYLAERFGADRALRLSCNFGAARVGPGHVTTAFFNPPNHLGWLDPANADLAAELAQTLTQGGLGAQAVEDIKFYIWKKMVMKCTMANLCAVTDRTIRDALEFPPTREIAFSCFSEALAVARAQGVDLGPDYLDQALAYLARVGRHKDSMCADLAQGSRTEIDFLGGKVVEYARTAGIAVPYYETMTNLVRAVEDSHLRSTGE